MSKLKDTIYIVTVLKTALAGKEEVEEVSYFILIKQ